MRRDTDQGDPTRLLDDQLGDILDGLDYGFLSCDADWQFTSVNRTAEVLTGIRREDLLGRNFWDVFAPALGTRLENEFRLAAAGAPREFENRYAPWDRWFHNRCFPRQGGGMSVFFRDVTERKRMEAELRESGERFRLLAEMAPVGVYLADALGRCTFVNHRWCAMTGMPREEALGQGWQRALHPEDRERVLEAWSAMLDSQTEWSLEYRFVAPDGRIAWASGSAARLCDGRGQTVGYVGVNTDITAAKRMEQLREDVEAVIRNEVKSPLLAVSSMVQLAMTGKLDERDAGTLYPQILCSVGQVLRMLDSSELLRHLEQGGSAPASDVLDIAGLLREARVNLLPQARRAGVTVLIDGADEASLYSAPRPMGTAFLVSDMFVNLLRHAVEASPRGGVVRVRCRAQGGVWRVEVLGQGALPEGMRERLFEKYAPGGASGGGGVPGLYSARLAARAHGGEVECVESADQGVTLRVTLPCRAG